MTIFETIGLIWVIFTATLAHAAILILAYRALTQWNMWAMYGRVTEMQDAREASRLREAVQKSYDHLR